MRQRILEFDWNDRQTHTTVRFILIKLLLCYGFHFFPRQLMKPIGCAVRIHHPWKRCLKRNKHNGVKRENLIKLTFLMMLGLRRAMMMWILWFIYIRIKGRGWSARHGFLLISGLVIPRIFLWQIQRWSQNSLTKIDRAWCEEKMNFASLLSSHPPHDSFLFITAMPSFDENGFHLDTKSVYC